MSILEKLKLSENNLGVYSSGTAWVGDEKQVIRSINPATKTVIASVLGGNSQDYERVVQQSCVAQKKWAKVPAPHRGEMIRQLGNKLRENKDYLGSLVTMEMGKIKQEGDGEVQEMIDIADFSVGQSRMLYGKTMHSERPQHRMYEQWHPLGVVGVISAFNFPVAVWAWNAFIAAIAGNTVIWKPSSKTPLCAIAVQHMCNEVMESFGHKDVFSLFISSDRAISQKLIEDERIALVSFTGSSQVGKMVSATVAKSMRKSLLECSGNNAMIVDESANISLAIPSIVFGSVGTAGQRCTSTRRLFVHRSMHTEVLAQLKNAYTQVNVGNPLEDKVLMGPLIDAMAVEGFVKTVDVALTQGGTLITGGKTLNENGYFVGPTIISFDRPMEIMREETFAPILYVVPFDDLTTAIEWQNDVPQGLSSAIFTDTIQHAELFLSAQGSDCGIANVNIGTSGAEIGGAFGGEKETGGGREAGSDSWRAYMRRQTNTINWGNASSLAQGIKFDLDR